MPAAVWSSAQGFAGVGCALTLMLPAAFLAHTTGARLLAVVAAELLFGAMVVSVRDRAARCRSQ